ncbi:MAG: terpene cyclase/mutase family protein [Planctomycetia bacterium]|nr:terpene cyclase/mutase family protein [Planctomycetia bacterium]
MSTTDSSFEMELVPARGQTPPLPAPAEPAPGESGEFGSLRLRFWLDGEVLSCACPDCKSPMSIRLWLMTADCWRCGASIELTEEEEREAKRLLAQRGLSAEILPAALEAARASPPPTAPQPRPRPARIVPAAIVPVAPPAPPARQLAAARPGPVRARIEAIEREGAVKVWFRDSLGFLIAWIASAVIHMALLILLAFVLFQPLQDKERPLTLSVRISDRISEGGFEDEPELDPLNFDDPGAMRLDDLAKPEPAGPEAGFGVPFELGALPGLEPAPYPLGALEGSGGKSPFAGRSPESRTRIALREGATTASEAAVTRGLEWLARHQNANGSWSLHAFNQHPDCRGKCRSTGVMSDTAGTALALLPFLGAGETHLKGRYKESVQKGLDWLVSAQSANGDLQGPGFGRMYAHGQAAIVLCEAFALTRDEKLRKPAQLALDFIVKAQHSEGGWRYAPRQQGDTSVVGWQLMALRSGQMAYLNVPEKVIDAAKQYLDMAQCDYTGSQYAYMPGHGPSHVMTAEALLCRQYTGWPANHVGLTTGCDWLLKEHSPNKGSGDVYYYYYATQVMHHIGGERWKKWNDEMRDLIVKSQSTEGHEAGSWDPRGGHSGSGGRLYQTALSICILEVYYRHMPLYRTVAAE